MNTSTTRSITYNGDRIEYELTIKRVKNMNMRITRDGVIHVSANAYVPDYRVDKFVIENMPFIERARYKIDALNAKRVEALQYVNGESLSILGIPVTLRLVEQDGKPRIGFDGKAILTMVVPRGTTFEAKHKLMQSYWRNLGEKVFCPLGKGRVSTLPQARYRCAYANYKTAAYEEPLGFLYASQATHQDEHPLIRGTTGVY